MHWDVVDVEELVRQLALLERAHAAELEVVVEAPTTPTASSEIKCVVIRDKDITEIDRSHEHRIFTKHFALRQRTHSIEETFAAISAHFVLPMHILFTLSDYITPRFAHDAFLRGFAMPQRRARYPNAYLIARVLLCGVYDDTHVLSAFRDARHLIADIWRMAMGGDAAYWRQFIHTTEFFGPLREETHGTYLRHVADVDFPTPQPRGMHINMMPQNY